MSKLRESLQQLLFSNPFTTALYPLGTLLIFLYPVIFMLNNALYISFLNGLNYVLYIFYLLGIIICIASNRDWAVAAALYIIAFGKLISVCNYFSFPGLLGIVVYILLGSFFVFVSVATKNGNDMLEIVLKKPERVTYGENVGSGNQGVVQAAKHCPSCGNLVEENALYCPFCGGRYPEEVLGGKTVIHPGVSVGGPIGLIMEICGSPLAMAFNILFSANILIQIISDFSLSTIVFQTLVILTSVSCWIIYVGSKKGNVTTTGFSILNVVLIIEMILYLILPVIGVFLGILLISSGYSDIVTVGVGIIIGSVIAGILLFFYWNGLRKVSTSAKAILTGKPVPWEASLFCIIINGMGALFSVIFLIVRMAFIQSFSGIIYNICNELNYYTGNTEVVNMLREYLEKAVLGDNPAMGILTSMVGIGVVVLIVILLNKIRASKQ